MNFIGIDLAWKEKGETAIIALDYKGEVIAHGCEKENTAIASFVDRYSADGCLVGIDAPLVVKNYEGRRQCEEMLQARGIQAYPANRSWFLRAFGAVRGEKLMAELEKIGFCLVDTIPRGRYIRGVMEVYPYATIRAVLPEIPPYKKGGKEQRLMGIRRLLSMLQSLKPPLRIPLRLLQLGGTIDDLKRASDFIDAAVAAYTVYVCSMDPGKCIILGNKEEGFVLLPRKF